MGKRRMLKKVLLFSITKEFLFFISEDVHKKVTRLASSIEHTLKSADDKRPLCIRSRYSVLSCGKMKAPPPYSTTPTCIFSASQVKKCVVICTELLNLLDRYCEKC